MIIPLKIILILLNSIIMLHIVKRNDPNVKRKDYSDKQNDYVIMLSGRIIMLTRIPIPSRVYLIDTGNEGRARDSRTP